MRVCIQLITQVYYNGRLYKVFHTFILTSEGGTILTINIPQFSQIIRTTRDDGPNEFCPSPLTRSGGFDNV